MAEYSDIMEPQVDEDQQTGPGPKQAPAIPVLAEPDRQRLGQIVQKMVTNKESDSDIQLVVDSFKKKYGKSGAQPPAVPTAPPPEHEIQHNSLQDIRHLLDVTNKPAIGPVAGPGGAPSAEYMQSQIDQSKAYKDQLQKRAQDYSKKLGVEPDALLKTLTDFPDEQDENKVKNLSTLSRQNPVIYDRLKDANTIRVDMAKSGNDGVNDANVFNHLQNASNYHELVEQNIPIQKELIYKHDLGQKGIDLLKNTQAPLINTLDADLLNKWVEEGKPLGLTPSQYAGYETEKLFSPNKAAMDLAIIKHAKGIDEDGKANPVDLSKEPYEYQRGVENVLYALDKQGRENTARYIAGQKPQIQAQVNDLQSLYQTKVNNAKTQDERAAIINEFNSNPLVQEATKLEQGQDELKYAEINDQRTYPLNFADQATRAVKDAIDGTEGIGTDIGKWFGHVAQGAGETADNTMRWIKNTAINLAGSEGQKAFNNAKNIGHQSLTDLSAYEPRSFTGLESPFVIDKDLTNGVQSIFNDPNLSSSEKEQKATALVRDNFDQLQVNPKAGQQNFTGKAIAFKVADTMGQILGLANQSFLMGGAIGDASKLQQMASAFTPMYMSTQNQMYEQALKNGEEHPLLKSNIDATIISLASLINPDLKVVKGMVGAETPLGKTIAGISEDTWNKVLTTNKPIVDRTIAAAKATGKQLGLANLQYGLIAPTAEYAAHKSILNEDPNLGDMIKDGVIQTSLTMALPSVLHGAWGGLKATEVNPLQKYAIVEAGLHPDLNIELIDGKIKSGQISEIQGHAMKQMVKHSGEILLNSEMVKTDGTPMNEQEVANSVYNQLRVKTLENKLKTAAGPLKPIIEGEIHDLNQDIAELHTSESDKHKNELNQLLTDNMPKLPELEDKIKDAVHRNEPEEIFNEIYDKATETKKVEGKNVSKRSEAEETYGKKLVQKAIDLHNNKKQANVKTENAPETKEIGQQEKPANGAEANAEVNPTAPSFLESRHADTVDDEAGKVSGPNDHALSKDGKKDANDLAKEVEGKGVTKIITSDLERAKETGKIVADKTGATVEHRPELNTWDIGDFDKTKDADFKKAQQYFVNHPDEKEFEGKKINESFNEYKDRIIKSRTELDKEPASTLVVNHSNNMMLWDAYVKNGHQWNEQAAKDYLSAKTPEPATLTNKTENNASTIRSDQGQDAQGGGIPQSSENVSGENLQQPQSQEAVPPGPDQQAGQQSGGAPAGEKVDEDWPFVDEPDDNKITSTQNKVTEGKVQEAGLIPPMKEAAREFGEVWEQAQKKIKKGFDVSGLIDNLLKKPRAVTDLENAMILYQQNVKEAQLDSVNKDIVEAAKKDDPQALQESKLIRTKLLDDLQQIYNVDKVVGRETARGLNARKMMADRRFSLVNMQMEKMAASEGKPLTETEQAEVEKKYQTIKDANDAYQKRVSELESENKALKEVAEQKKEAKGPKKSKEQYSKERKDIVQRMRDDLLKAAKGGEGLTSSIPLAAQLKAVAPHIKDLVKSFIDQGIDKLDGITAGIHNILKPMIPELNESHIHDLIAGEFTEPTVKDPSQPVSKPTEIKNQAKQQKYAITDPQTMKLRAEYERQKDSWNDALKKAKLSKRTKLEKVEDAFVAWQRASKLSGITTLAKLGMAAVTRLTTTPIEEGVGGIYSAALPGIAKKATGEGGLNVKAEAKAITSAFTQGMKDSYDIMSKGKRGKSDIEAIFGKKGELPPEAIGFFGQLHSAIKAPIKRAAFERSMTKRIAANLKNGVDVSDPLVQSKIALQAYKDAQRAIFMQDNFVSEKYRNFVNSLEKSKTHPELAKGAATLMQWMIPFVKVPTNIVGEVGTHVAGIPIATAKIAHSVFTKGLANLSEDEADMVMRNLKKGSLGAAALLLGYFNPANFGGYYQQGEKRDKNDAGPGGIKIFGHKIPVWLLESPIFQTMQLGATVRRVKDTVVKGEPKGIGEGVWAGALGLAEHEPLIDQPTRILEAIKSPKERDYFIDELAKSTIEPALLSNIAQFTDSDVKRSPSNLKEHLEMGVPGLRENVPAKGEQKRTRSRR